MNETRTLLFHNHNCYEISMDIWYKKWKNHQILKPNSILKWSIATFFFFLHKAIFHMTPTKLIKTLKTNVFSWEPIVLGQSLQLQRIIPVQMQLIYSCLLISLTSLVTVFGRPHELPLKFFAYGTKARQGTHALPVNIPPHIKTMSWSHHAYLPLVTPTLTNPFSISCSSLTQYLHQWIPTRPWRTTSRRWRRRNFQTRG